MSTLASSAAAVEVKAHHAVSSLATLGSSALLDLNLVRLIFLFAAFSDVSLPSSPTASSLGKESVGHDLGVSLQRTPSSASSSSSLRSPPPIDREADARLVQDANVAVVFNEDEEFA